MLKFRIISYVLIFLLLITCVHSWGDSDSDQGEVQEVTEDEQAQEAYENDQSFTAKEEVTVDGHTFPAGTEFNSGSGFDVPEGKHIVGPDGGKYTGSGIRMENGGLKGAEQIGMQTSQGKSEGRNAQNMNMNPPDYTIGSADFWQTPTHTIYNGNGIQKSANAFSVKSADKIELNNMTLTNAELLYSTEDALSIVSAEEVEGNGLNAENIINSNLQFDDGLTGGKILSSKDNNT